MLCGAQHIEFRVTFFEEFGYFCDVREFVITQNETLSVAFVGDHIPGRSNIDVDLIHFQHYPPVPFFVTELFTTYPNLRRMNLNQGTHLNIQSGSFENALNLENLEISNSNVVLSDFALTGAGNVTVLQIADCESLRIDEFAFAGLGSLKTLFILRSNIHQLPGNIFSSLVNLEQFSLHQGFVETIPSNLFANNHLLTSISIIGNPIDAIERTFINHLGQLQSLILSGQFGNETCLQDGGWWNVRESWEEMHRVLEQCYRNYEELPRHFSMELRGSLLIRDRNGDVVVRV